MAGATRARSARVLKRRQEAGVDATEGETARKRRKLDREKHSSRKDSVKEKKKKEKATAKKEGKSKKKSTSKKAKTKKKKSSKSKTKKKSTKKKREEAVDDDDGLPSDYDPKDFSDGDADEGEEYEPPSKKKSKLQDDDDFKIDIAEAEEEDEDDGDDDYVVAVQAASDDDDDEDDTDRLLAEKQKSEGFQSNVRGSFVLDSTQRTFSTDAIAKDERRQKRWERFNRSWSQVQKRIDSCLEGVNSNVFNALGTQIKTSGREIARVGDHIPVALLQTGLNVSDHDLYCDHLCAHLRRHRTRHERAFEQSKEFRKDPAPPALVARVPLGMKSIAATMHLIVDKLAEEALRFDQKHPTRDSDSSDGSQSSSSSSKYRLKHKRDKHALRDRRGERLNYSDRAVRGPRQEVSRFALPERWSGDPSAVLVEWYKSSYSNVASPPLVVIVVEDPSQTPRRLLQALMFEVKRLREHAGIACALVLCMSVTADNALHGLLSARVISFLQIRRFELRSSFESFESVIKNVVLRLKSSPDVVLGARASQYLMTSFVQSSFSVTASVRLLRFCYLEHFKAQEMSFLISQTEIENYEPTQKDLDLICALPSIRKLSRRPTTEEIRKQLSTLHKVRDTRQPLVWLFMTAIRDVMRAGAFKEESEDGEDRVAAEFSERRLYPVFFKPFAERKELALFWKRFDSPSLRLQDLRRILATWRANYRPVMGGKTERIDTVLQEVETAISGGGTQKLDGKAARRNLRRGDHATTRDSVKKYFQGFERMYLRPFSAYPMHELILFDDSSALRRSFEPEMMVNLRNHLRSHQKVISCKCCKGLPATQESINVVYQQMTEFGRQINLYDWFNSFCAACGSYGDEDDEKKEDSDDEMDDDAEGNHLQIVFREEVDALKFMGLLKQGRKTDHVDRLALKIT